MGAPPRILVVDDEPAVTGVVGEFFQRLGHDVRTVSSGNAALDALGEAATDLVLLDLDLPDVAGVTVLHQARQLRPAPDVVILTGHATLESAICAVDEGAAAYIIKPPDFDQLERTVGDVLDRRRRAHRLRTLTRMTRLVSSSLDVDEVLRAISCATAELMGADVVSVWVADESRRALEVRAFSDAARGAAFPARRIRFDQGGVGWVARHRTILNVTDVLTDDRFPAREWWSTLGLSSFAAVPVVHEGRLLAVLALNGRAPFAFTDDDRDLLESFVAHTAVALENARVFAESETRRGRAEALATLGRRLVQSLDLAEVAQCLVDGVPALFRCQAARLASVDASTGNLVTLATTGADGLGPGPAVLPRGTDAAGLAVQLGEPVTTSNVLADNRIMLAADARAHLAHTDLRSVLAVPLVISGRAIGALSVSDWPGRLFSDEERAFAVAVADQAALALETARLYEEAETQSVRLAQIFDSTSDGIVLVGAQGEIVAANRRAEELLAFDRDEVVGLALVDLLVTHYAEGANFDAVFASFAALLADPSAGGEGDIDLPRVGRVVHWVARATRDHAGQTVGLTLTFQDVTLEREVSRMKSDFVSFVTHQLRTPLAGIKWLLELCAGLPGVPGDALSYVDDARTAAERLTALVNNLLDIARLESGRLTLVPVPTDLGALTETVLEDLRGRVGDKRHRVRVVADEPRPPVCVDPELMRQVVVNLTSNAIKYTPPEGEITIRIGRDGARAVWSIEDTGIGIPRESRARLFEKFYRADNAVTMETEGTGLGLCLARLIVERSGGGITCESEEGRGTTFSVTLPLGG